MFLPLLKNIFSLARSNGARNEKPDFQAALAHQQAGRLTEAQVMYETLLIDQPQHLGALHGLAVIATARKEYDLALELFTEVTGISPDSAKAHVDRGATLLKLKQVEAAVACFDRAIDIDPHFAKAYNGRGCALHMANRLEEAVCELSRAIEIAPDLDGPHVDLGNVLMELGQTDAAMASFDRAIAMRQSHTAPALLNKSLLLLRNGNFPMGWPLYESRWQAIDTLKRRDCVQPLWHGEESLHDSTVLLYSEQGFGDTIQFCRYARLVAARGARVIAEVQQPLAGILKGLEGVSDVLQAGSPLPPFDYHCPLLSLPLAFRTSIETIPRADRYLFSDADKLAYWSKKLGVKARPRIGLVWTGNPAHGNDHNRSIALSSLLPYLPNSFEYFSLQNEVRDSDREALEASPIRHNGAELKDFSDTAALCDLMDLVICVDTSVTHLSGALGRPTWLLLPYVPDWRWLLDRDDSPWYPSMKLYRQTAKREWKEVLEKVHSDLLLFAEKDAVNA